MFHFAQPGSITKEVVVDASAMPALHKGSGLRRIDFVVDMDSGDPAQRLRYAEPLGFISLGARSGVLKVVYDYTMEPVADDDDR